MIRFLRKYIQFSDRLADKTGAMVSWITFILVLVICYDVVMRYLFNRSSVAIYELEWHLFSLIFLLGAAFALKHDRHVRVDVIYSKLGIKTQAWINLLGTIFFLLPLCAILIFEGWNFVEHSLRLSESSADAGGLPARFLVKSAIPLGFTLVSIQAFNLIITSILIIKGETLKGEKSG